MIPEQFRLKNTIKHPTSLLIGGLSKLGIEIAEALLEQGGYVVIVDTYSNKEFDLPSIFGKDVMVSFVDYTNLTHLDEDLRRLDYIFFFLKESIDPRQKVSTQHFLNFSNYLDASLTLASKFDAKFLLATTIRTHQFLIYEQENYIKNSQNTSYTELEIHRYAENLTLEYVERVDLDARIVRVGEIIGDAIDLSLDSRFKDLILAAAKNEPLVLYKDGLETEWLVHLLDAAYGVIKAQFSKNTKGEVFSICYESPFTHLSIAYKIQEVEEGSQEIVFSDQGDNLPSLKLYKPAKNLSTIGWMPRVPLDRAIKQSIIAAKIFLLEQKNRKNEETTIVDKIKSFVNLADTQKKIEDKDLEGLGPISRLIEERKRQEALRMQSIELANTSIKTKRRLKPKSFREKLQDQIWNIVIDVGNKVSFLKNRTPLEFFFIILFFLFLLFGYIFILSPTIFIYRGALALHEYIKEFEKNYSEFEFGKSKGNLVLVNNELNSIQRSFESTKLVFAILGIDDYHQKIINNISLYKQFLENSITILGYLEPVSNYFNAFSNNTQLRLTTENYLSVVKSGINHSLALEELQSNAYYINFYVDRILGLKKLFKSFDYSIYPQFISNYFESLNNKIITIIDEFNYFKLVNYFDKLIGHKNAKNYLILLLDNTRPRPLGGEISAFAILSFKNGSLVQTLVRSIYDTDFKLSNLSPDVMAEINLRRYKFKVFNDLTFVDFSNTSDMNYLLNVLNQVFKSETNLSIDGIVATNLSAINNFFDLIKSSELNINYEKYFDINGTKFLSSNILNSYKLALGDDSTLQKKSRISAQLLSNLLYFIFDNYDIVVPLILKNITNFTLSREVSLITNNKKYINDIVSMNIIPKINLDFESGIVFEDPQYVHSEKFHSLSSILKLNIDKDQSIKLSGIQNVNIFPSYKEMYFCFPGYIKNQNVNLQLLASQNWIINGFQDKKCLVGYAVTENEIQFSLGFDGINIAEIKNDEYFYSIGFKKFGGMFTPFDFEASISPDLRVIQILPEQILQENKILYSLEKTKDFVFGLRLVK